MNKTPVENNTPVCSLCGDPIRRLRDGWVHIPDSPTEVYDHLPSAQVVSGAQPSVSAPNTPPFSDFNPYRKTYDDDVRVAECTAVSGGCVLPATSPCEPPSASVSRYEKGRAEDMAEPPSAYRGPTCTGCGGYYGIHSKPGCTGIMPNHGTPESPIHEDEERLLSDVWYDDGPSRWLVFILGVISGVFIAWAFLVFGV